MKSLIFTSIRGEARPAALRVPPAPHSPPPTPLPGAEAGSKEVKTFDSLCESVAHTIHAGPAGHSRWMGDSARRSAGSFFRSMSACSPGVLDDRRTLHATLGIGTCVVFNSHHSGATPALLWRGNKLPCLPKAPSDSRRNGRRAVLFSTHNRRRARSFPRPVVGIVVVASPIRIGFVRAGPPR